MQLKGFPPASPPPRSEIPDPTCIRGSPQTARRSRQSQNLSQPKTKPSLKASSWRQFSSLGCPFASIPYSFGWGRKKEKNDRHVGSSVSTVTCHDRGMGCTKPATRLVLSSCCPRVVQRRRASGEATERASPGQLCEMVHVQQQRLVQLQKPYQ